MLSIQFLARLVDKDDIPTVVSKITAIKNFPTPKTQQHVRFFLGLVVYHEAFANTFALIASPLSCQLRKNVSFMWKNAQQQNFDTHTL